MHQQVAKCADQPLVYLIWDSWDLGLLNLVSIPARFSLHDLGMPFNLSVFGFSHFLLRIGSQVVVHICLYRKDLRVFHNSVKSWSFCGYWDILIGDLVTLSMSFPFL